jgi:DNA-binding transcriptional LysR family regulator
MVLAPATYPLAKRKTIALAELADQPLVEFPQGWGVRMATDPSVRRCRRHSKDHLRGQ